MKTHNRNQRFLSQVTKCLLSLVALFTLLLSACSEKGTPKNTDNPPTLSNTPDRTIMLPEFGTPFNDLIILPTVHFSSSNIQTEVPAIPLGKFVSEHNEPLTENQAKLFTYRIVSNDLFNPWTNRGQYDLYWHKFTEGYLAILENQHRTYFEEYSLESNYAYNVQTAEKLELYRTVNVVKPNGDEVMFHVNLLNHQDMQNPQNNDALENSFALLSLITEYITNTPEKYEYTIIAADWTGGTTGIAVLSWYHLQNAWYSRDIERVFFPTIEDFTGSMRLRDLIRVELHP